MKVGDKVVPHAKTRGCGLECSTWNDAKRKGQPFLYLVRIDRDNNSYICSANVDGFGDWFNFSDLTLFKEKTMQKFKRGDKVIPISKSIMGGLEYSGVWRRAQRNEQPFIYVNGYKEDESDVVLCSVHLGGSNDYFKDCDLVLFDQPEFKQGQAVYVSDRSVEEALQAENSRIFVAKVTEGFLCHIDGEDSISLYNDLKLSCWKHAVAIPAKISVKVDLNDDYTAIVSKDTIKVGCQTFPIDILDELNEAYNSLD